MSGLPIVSREAILRAVEQSGFDGLSEDGRPCFPLYEVHSMQQARKRREMYRRAALARLRERA
jgi:hypothetical protein